MESITGLFNTIFDAHPWHVPTVHFPIALTGVGLLFLLLALWQRNEALERAAFYNVTLAALSTLAAGLTGYRDYLVRFEGDAPYINLKIFLAITLFVLTAAIAVVRWRQPEVLWRPTTMVLYIAGFAASFILASLLGFIGGIILYGF
ncbi:MAG: hypothetical protein Fur0044_31790 [Anaerolineae bacterium]|nr:hypothetical protein [Anaerolineales bacterium]MCQ3975024.1 hypothetical protein [Anaerolineae bacterium]